MSVKICAASVSLCELSGEWSVREEKEVVYNIQIKSYDLCVKIGTDSE